MDARLFWLAVGCVLGFFAGYITRSLREIQQKVDNVEKRVVSSDHRDDGLVRIPWLLDMVLLIVVTMTAYAAILSQRSSNKVTAQQETNTRIISCTQAYLAETINALNARTQYTVAQNNANVKLQRAQSDLLTKLLQLDENSPPDAGTKALRAYLGALTDYTTVATKSNVQVSNNPFPKSGDLLDCVSHKN